MKTKIIAAVIGALVLVVGGTLAATALTGGTVASKKQDKPKKPKKGEDQYPGRVATKCTVDVEQIGNPGKGKSEPKLKYTWSVDISGSNKAPASGTFSFTLKNNGSTVERSSKSAGNGVAKVAKGSYAAEVTYTPTSGSVYEPCSATTSGAVR